jgi:predicted ribosome-associated RNA-binding protein Tma20
MSACASCGNKVDGGAIRCLSCGAQLYLPGTFIQVMGWVVASLSIIPFAVSLVTTKEGDYIPLIAGAVVLIFGLILAMAGRMRNRTATPTVVEEPKLTPEGF